MLKKVVLHLARTPDYPNGSGEHGYGFVLPLDGEGRLDEAAWERHQQDCTVHRFWRGQPDERGLLVQTEEGEWAFAYDPKSPYDEEAIFRLNIHKMEVGEYISVTGHDGQQRPFRIDSVEGFIQI